MSLTPDHLRQAARLARIALDSEEISDYSRHLSTMIDFIDPIKTVDTQGVSPMIHPHTMTQRLRVDEVTQEDQRARFLSVAPATQEGLYLVPKVIE
jgi:aspartyl-tRNA(Asn)/glutamyl-tRNA(Gln) amidotransferase subunit C